MQQFDRRDGIFERALTRRLHARAHFRAMAKAELELLDDCTRVTSRNHFQKLAADSLGCLPFRTAFTALVTPIIRLLKICDGGIPSSLGGLTTLDDRRSTLEAVSACRES